MSRRRFGVLLAIALALVLASPAGVAGTQADDWPDDTYEDVPRGSHSGAVSPADDTDRFRVPVSVNEVINVSVSTEAGDEVEARFEYPGGSATLTDDGTGERRRIGIARDGHVSVTVSGTAGANWTVSVARERSANPTSTPTPDPTPGGAVTSTATPTPSGSPTPTPTQSPVPDGTATPATTPTEGAGGSSSGGGGGGGGQSGADAAGEVEIADRALLNGSATTGTAVVARVDLVNYDPVRGTLSLTLTADGSTVTERSVAVAASSERTVLLRHAFDRPGSYELAVNGATVGTVAVAEPATATPAPTSTPAPTATPTPPTGTSTVGSTGTADGVPTRTAPGTAEDRSATAGDGAGFGVPVALLALLMLGALRRRD